jgi:uncharacterized membrane protein YedE/YeeE
MQLLITLVSGIVFGLGLCVAQMTDPAKVIGFLNILGDWDPSLAFVMGSGLLVMMLAYRFTGTRSAPLFGREFHLPLKQHIDTPLVTGSLLFGIGWGIAGYCPGPIITSLSFANQSVLMIFVAYLVGTLITRWLLQIRLTKKLNYGTE